MKRVPLVPISLLTIGADNRGLLSVQLTRRPAPQLMPVILAVGYRRRFVGSRRWDCGCGCERQHDNITDVFLS
jgi:hypothetical protein